MSFGLIILILIGSIVLLFGVSLCLYIVLLMAQQSFRRRNGQEINANFPEYIAPTQYGSPAQYIPTERYYVSPEPDISKKIQVNVILPQTRQATFRLILFILPALLAVIFLDLSRYGFIVLVLVFIGYVIGGFIKDHRQWHDREITLRKDATPEQIESPKYFLVPNKRTLFLRPVLNIFFWFILFYVLVGAHAFLYTTNRFYVEKLDWETTEGRVIYGEEDDEAYYEYWINNRYFTNTKNAYFPRELNQNSDYENFQEVTVYYDPDDPHQSVLNRGSRRPSSFVYIFMLFMGFGLGMIIKQAQVFIQALWRLLVHKTN